MANGWQAAQAEDDAEHALRMIERERALRLRERRERRRMHADARRRLQALYKP